MGDQFNYGGYPGGNYGGVPANNHQTEALKAFWQSQLVEVSEVPPDPAVFKNHQLPLARIKKIMKSDEDVRMISAEAPVLFAKACEMFILELTLRSWMHAEENKRRTLQRNDVAAAITKTDIFDFLIDIVPREDIKQEEGQAGPTGAAMPPPAAAAAQAMQASAPRPPGPGGVPGLGPGMFFPPPYGQMPPGVMGGDPNQAAAAAAAAAAMMRPPMGMDPALVSLYQQQMQRWPHMAGLPPPPTLQQHAAAVAAAQAAGVAQAHAQVAAAHAQAQAAAQAQAQAAAAQAAGEEQNG